MAITSTATRALSHLLSSSSAAAATATSPSLSLRLLRTTPLSLALRRPFSSPATPYPLYYELIRYRPARRSPPLRPAAASADEPPNDSPSEPIDRSKSKYYRKRRKRMYGASDSESDRAPAEEHVDLHPEVVDFPRLHAREQELYFYDAFAFPWEKEKHYRMVYQLEKKYFPDHCLDKAFLDHPTPEPLKASTDVSTDATKKRRRGKRERKKDGGEERDERDIVFFDEDKDKAGKEADPVADRNASEKNVEDFFKCLKKVPNVGAKGASLAMESDGEPYFVSRKTQLPPRWDGPSGTVILVDKPKGWF